jgi:hypothetical protein
MGLGKKVFTNKTFGAQLYKWSPLPTTKNANLAHNKPFYCTATAGSQGEDWITTYSYNITVVNGQQGHSAYVACDYVE